MTSNTNYKPWDDSNLIFLCSLPRSGSTLLQRLLASSKGIATTPESWALLPQFYGTKQEGVCSEYGHRSAYNGFKEYCEKLPNGADTYRSILRRFYVELFRASCTERDDYYLEKTPRNSLIIEMLIEVFPNAKFIFLWRNPLSVVASMVKTFEKNKWKMYKYNVDLYDGLDNLIRVYTKHRGKVCAVKYEDLILNPGESLAVICNYLHIDYDPELCNNFINMNLDGAMGDPTGTIEYNKIDAKSLDSWSEVISNPIRKMVLRRYINWIDKWRLSVIGYDKDELLYHLENSTTNYRYLLNDIIYSGYGVLDTVFSTSCYIFRKRDSRRKNLARYY